MKRFFLALFLIILVILCFSACEKCDHNFKDPTCTEGGSCIMCGEIGPPPKGHTWLDATCQSPKSCKDCGITQGDLGDHIWNSTDCDTTPICVLCRTEGEKIRHDWLKATCFAPRTCTKCSDTIGIPLSHKWTSGTCTEAIICTLCNTESQEANPHSWVFNGCESSRTCSVCFAEEGIINGHRWKNATCTTPRYCMICEEISFPATGHNWSKATCTEAKTCLTCNVTDGEPLGHSWKLINETEASCSPAKAYYSCFCGEEKSETIKPANRFYHVCDAQGLCTVCHYQFDLSLMTLDSVIVGKGAYTVREGLFSSTETSQQIFKPLTYSDLGMPIVELNGDISKISKTNTATINFSYDGGKEDRIFDCLVEIKIQGASSAGYPKKNYSIKLFNEDETKHKVKLHDGWGKQFKYCMKANWVDYSQARNVVSGKIYGDIIEYRDIEDQLTELENGGAVDGFPIVVYLNGEFLGLYTMNIPKDKWMFDMKDSDEKNQAIVMGEHWGNSVAMKEPISINQNASWTGSSNWELEFASNEESLIDNNTNWVPQSLNNLINFVINNTGESFKNGIHQYADVDKCIDSMIYTFFICAEDNISKNILWVTYDGQHWFSSVYDMDGTWGLKWNGNVEFAEDFLLINNLNLNNYNLLWQRLYVNFYDQIVERYQELRQGPLSYENIEQKFTKFFSKIPDAVRVAEKTKWPNAYNLNHGYAENNLEQILQFAQKRMSVMDEILVPKE